MMCLRTILFLVCFVFSSHSSVASESVYSSTRLPVVMVHGMFGWDKMLGVLDYFYLIPQDLVRAGADIHLASVSPLDSAEVRGEQLLSQVETILAITGAPKVHLLGHSQGAPTSRYVEAVRPDLVASITTVSGANYGSPVADLLWTPVENGKASGRLLNRAAKLVGELINLLSDRKVEDPARFMDSLYSLTTKEANKFNDKYSSGISKTPCKSLESRALSGVHFFSIGGTAPFTSYLDPGDYILAMIQKLIFKKEASDGLVSRCSSHLGQVIRDDYDMNHLDALNHFFGLSGTNPKPIYRQALNRLQNLHL